MKKQLATIITASALIVSILTGCTDETSSRETGAEKIQNTDNMEKTVKVTLNEVAHSIFYAPMYVAIEEGYFEENGIDLDLVCGFGESISGKDHSVRHFFVT